MARAFRFARRVFIYPTTRVVSLHVSLWTSLFGKAWESLRFDEQLIYLWFAAQTIAILTLFELILLK